MQVPGLTAVRAIAAGSASSFAIMSNGSMSAWGAGGTLGDGTMVNRLSPVPVPTLSNIEQISASYNGLARTTAGEVWFWGLPGGRRAAIVGADWRSSFVILA